MTDSAGAAPAMAPRISDQALRESRSGPHRSGGAPIAPWDGDGYPREAIAAQRERAERLLNVLRLGVLLLLAGAALAYGPHIPPAVQRVNWLVLAPVLVWTVAQLLLTREGRMPGWLAVANPLVDITAVTAILGGYGLTQSAALALKSPIFLAYFAILAARPITSSTRIAVLALATVILEYGLLSCYFVTSGRVALTASPVIASAGPAVSLLDEEAKLLLLLVAGGIATYATAWHERLVRTYHRQSADRERLEVELARAELETLKLQLSPHFLFNTLNNISALIAIDGRAAERMLGGLSDFLRLSLYNSGAPEVPLEREIQMLERYLTIQQLRFQDRLAITIAADPALGGALVPNLVLQPLAENAIRHGLAPRASGGRLDVSARRRNGMLVLRVSDDGVGCDVDELATRQAPSRPGGSGIGLGNTRARLATLYGAAARVEVSSWPGRGFTVTMTIPYHTEPTPAAAARRGRPPVPISPECP